MILPIDYLWSQLNGPQVKGITDAIFDYWKIQFDEKLDYFNQLSVNTVNDQHLTLLGLLSGLIRPVITEADRDYFLFTEDVEHNFTKGFSDLEDPTIGGRLTKLDVGQGVQNTSLDEEHYRALLRAWTSGAGEIGSLALLDEICYQLHMLDIPEQEPFYRFKFMTENIPSDRTYGDVYIDMGDMPQWRNPLHIYAVLNGIGNTAYAPVPRLFVSLGPTGRVSNPSISPESQTYEEPITVTMACNTDTASIYYTLDGTTPTAESTLYEEPFVLDLPGTTTVKAIGIAPDFGASDVVTRQYTLPES